MVSHLDRPTLEHVSNELAETSREGHDHAEDSENRPAEPSLWDRAGDQYVLMTMGIAVGLAGAEGVDTTTLDLDRYGADIVQENSAHPAIVEDASRGPDITTLYLDRFGADMPAGNWWVVSNYAGGADASGTQFGPDITGLQLDKDLADVFPEDEAILAGDADQETKDDAAADYQEVHMAADITGLHLDGDLADIFDEDDARAAAAGWMESTVAPDIAGLNLDKDLADIFEE